MRITVSFQASVPQSSTTLSCSHAWLTVEPATRYQSFVIKKPRTAIGVAILVVLSLLVLIGNWLGRTSVPERPSTSKPQDISAAGADRGVPSATLPESAPRAAEASGQSKAIAAAKASILDLSKEFESKNAKWIFHRMLGKTEWAVVALGAPDEDQIAAVSNRLTQIIQAAPADQQDRLRSELQSLYRNAVSYLATHKVLYFMSPEAPAPWMLLAKRPRPRRYRSRSPPNPPQYPATYWIDTAIFFRQLLPSANRVNLATNMEWNHDAAKRDVPMLPSQREYCPTMRRGVRLAARQRIGPKRRL